MKMFPKDKRMVLLLIGLSISAAAIIIGNGNTVGYATSGIQAGTAEGGTYTARFLLTASDKPGGGPNTIGGTYTANIGFFNSSVIGNVYSGGEVQIPLSSGWNLISIPLEI